MTVISQIINLETVEDVFSYSLLLLHIVNMIYVYETKLVNRTLA